MSSGATLTTPESTSSIQAANNRLYEGVHAAAKWQSVNSQIPMSGLERSSVVNL